MKAKVPGQCPLCDAVVIDPAQYWEPRFGWAQHRWQWHMRKNHPGWLVEFSKGRLEVVRDE